MLPPFLFKIFIMAVNVDTVYKTVLLILNKEQRGYIPPYEFNKIATQVQLEIFEKYFEDLNQQLRVPENDSEYANRVKNIDEKIDIFKKTGNATYNAGYFYLPSDLHRLGTVIYYDAIEVQRLQRNEFLLISKSPLTAPTTQYPVYMLEGTVFIAALHNKIFVHPSTIQSGISASYIIKPISPEWTYTVDATTGAFLYDNAGTDFQLHPSEQTDIILNILMYSGVIIRDPQIVQNAAAMVQQDEVNAKS